MLRKMYATEIAQAKNLRRTANQLLELQKRAEEAKDLMDIHIARRKVGISGSSEFSDDRIQLLQADLRATI